LVPTPTLTLSALPRNPSMDLPQSKISKCWIDLAGEKAVLWLKCLHVLFSFQGVQPGRLWKGFCSEAAPVAGGNKQGRTPSLCPKDRLAKGLCFCSRTTVILQSEDWTPCPVISTKWILGKSKKIPWKRLSCQSSGLRVVAGKGSPKSPLRGGQSEREVERGCLGGLEEAPLWALEPTEEAGFQPDLSWWVGLGHTESNCMQHSSF
jgi:hypothetical protein